MKSVVLGLSGGVDSACAAKLLLDEGYAVHGLWLDTGSGSYEDAESVARSLGIGFERLDIREELEKNVKAPFAAAYLAGRTPNPCILCNPLVKFPALLAAADRLGAEFVATGHYARVRRDEKSGRAKLLRSAGANDQSYMLCGLTQEILSRLLLPLGELPAKTETRRLASSSGIPVADKPDSMEICFIPDGDYAGFIEARGQTPPPGDLVDDAGNVIGRHEGIHHYTIGQRRGLGFAAGRRVFVSAIDPERDRVTLSDGQALMASSCRAGPINWVSIKRPDNEFLCTVRVRHSKVEYPARARPAGELAEIEFVEPVRAPTPGQSAVFYDGEFLLGGGVIQ